MNGMPFTLSFFHFIFCRPSSSDGIHRASIVKSTLAPATDHLIRIILYGLIFAVSFSANASYCHNFPFSGNFPLLLGQLSADDYGANANDIQILPLLPLGIGATQPLTPEKIKLLFQEAATAVQKYQETWEGIFQRQLSIHLLCAEHGRCLPDKSQLAELVLAKLTWSDFADTAAILDQAMLAVAAPNSDPVKERLETLFLHQEHAALQFQVWNKLNQNAAEEDSLRQGLTAARQLQQFRQNFATELHPWLSQLTSWEQQNGDLAGKGWQALFEDAEPLRKLPALALLRIDQAGMARQQNWQHQNLDDWKKHSQATPFQIDHPWSAQVQASAQRQPLWLMLHCPLDDLEIKDKSQLYLNFRGLPGRCVVFQNGRELFRKHELLPESFRVPIEKSTPNAKNAGSTTELRIIVQLIDGTMQPQKNWPVWLSEQK